MGEIKSTLEIIMEKSKGFTMTEEEKAAFQEKEVQGKVKGLFVKFMDNWLDLVALKNEIDTFDQKHRETAMHALIMECLHCLDPERDNAPILDVLEKVANLDIAVVNRGLTECQERLAHERSEQERSLAKSLEEQGISGTAVIPNTSADVSWVLHLKDTKEACRESLEALLLSK